MCPRSVSVTLAAAMPMALQVRLDTTARVSTHCSVSTRPPTCSWDRLVTIMADQVPGTDCDTAVTSTSTTAEQELSSVRVPATSGARS